MHFLFKEHNIIKVNITLTGEISSVFYPKDMCSLISLWLDAHNALSFLSIGAKIFVLDNILIVASPKKEGFHLTLTPYRDSLILLKKITQLEKQTEVKARIVSYLFGAIISLTLVGAGLNAFYEAEKSSSVFSVVNGLNPLLAAICGYYFSESKKDG